MLGKLTDKLMANVEAENASYPRFESYDRRMKIRDIVEGIDFEGGFSMQGAKLQGYGTKEEPAYLTFYRDKRPFIVAAGCASASNPSASRATMWPCASAWRMIQPLAPERQLALPPR
ncbi:MAG: hypothetical protein IPJ85_12970 [Flavobacteriales bacterium]|nr:hypothetical protein [Flavobacteriales bacterium]